MSSRSDHVSYEDVAYENPGYENAAYETEDPADITLLRPPNAGYDLTLRVVPLEDIVPHEHYHAPRVAELTTRLMAEGKLINPPVVAQQGTKYVVLDGATRLTAFRQIGLPYLVVQVVNLDQPQTDQQQAVQQQVQLTSWNHAIYGGSAASLLATLGMINGLRLVPVGMWHASNAPLPSGALGYLLTVDGEAFVLEASSLSGTAVDEAWLRVLNALVETYGAWGNVERTLSRDVTLLANQFPDLAALVIFPSFTPETILTLAAQERTVPAGITRFVIPGRILRLNAPLTKLAADEPLAAKQAWLDGLVREKLRARQVRYYEEPVVLLDE